MNSWSTRELQGSETVLFNGRLSKSIECTIQRMNPNVNTGLWVMMLCQCWFTDYSTSTYCSGGVCGLCGRLHLFGVPGVNGNSLLPTVLLWT